MTATVASSGPSSYETQIARTEAATFSCVSGTIFAWAVVPDVNRTSASRSESPDFGSPRRSSPELASSVKDGVLCAATCTSRFQVGVPKGATGSASSAGRPTSSAWAPNLSRRVVSSDRGSARSRGATTNPARAAPRSATTKSASFAPTRPTASPSAQPGAVQAVGHVVDQCGEFAIGDRDSIASDH
jgi:hypothetical protein